MRILYTTLLVVLIDQSTKLSIKGFSIPFLNIHYQGLGHRIINVFGDFFQIVFVENPGMAFGIDLNVYTKLFISVFSIVASVGLFYYLYSVRNQSFSLRLAIALILAGALGNLIDRVFYGLFYGYAPLFYGSVVDFISIDIPNLTILGRQYDRFPIFNIADTAVTVGVVILLLFYRKHEREVTNLKSNPDEPLDAQPQTDPALDLSSAVSDVPNAAANTAEQGTPSS